MMTDHSLWTHTIPPETWKCLTCMEAYHVAELEAMERYDHLRRSLYETGIKQRRDEYTNGKTVLPDERHTEDKQRDEDVGTSKLTFGIDRILTGSFGSKKNNRSEESSTSKVYHTSRMNRLVASKRAVFSDKQRHELEREFLIHKYITKHERKELAHRLGLSESQVRIWFQNRRMKWRNIEERETMRQQRMKQLSREVLTRY